MKFSGWRKVVSSAVALVLMTVGLTAFSSTAASAINAADFDPGHIISDANFYDSAAMSESEIAAFLEAKIGRCNNGNCLNVVKTSTTTRVADAVCGEYRGAANESVASILFKVQRACGISAKVLLVNLQKEQSLVTSKSPSLSVLDRAMGYGCPDDATRPGWCDPAFGGLYNQIYRSAWQFKRYSNPPGTSNSFTWIPVGGVSNIGFHPDANRCGSTPVRVQNKATAALYYYTPYQPNAAALSNLYGTGDGCSSYGNRNFWRMYTDWFGSTVGNPEAIGRMDEVAGVAGGVRLSGWVGVPSDARAVPVKISIGQVVKTAVTGLPRLDVQRAHPTLSGTTGFAINVPLAPGTYQVCARTEIDKGAANLDFGCRSVVIPPGFPFGEIDSSTSVGDTLTVRGWAADSDSTEPISVHVYAAGSAVAVRADHSRPDVKNAYSLPSDRRGFEASISVPSGTHEVCAYAINAGPGDNLLIGCQRLTTTPTQNKTPVGNLELVELSGKEVRVAGWALDPDTARPIPVHVYVGGDGSSHLASIARGDVGSAFFGHGPGHGFDVKVPASPGSHQVCVYAINDGAGGHTQLGCKTVQVPDRDRVPTGSLELVSVEGGQVRVAGWALDPDTSAAIPVHVYVGGSGSAHVAQIPRSDIGRVFPDYGPGHGFDVKVPASPGSHQVCVYAINDGAGGHTQLGCKTVQVPDRDRVPTGSLELVSVEGGQVRVAGWALDPDTSAAIPVHVYVGGSGSAHVAQIPRSDIGRVFPDYGPGHGFDVKVPASPGSHQVCVYAINDGAGGHTQLGCKTVQVQ